MLALILVAHRRGLEVALSGLVVIALVRGFLRVRLFGASRSRMGEAGQPARPAGRLFADCGPFRELAAASAVASHPVARRSRRLHPPALHLATLGRARQHSGRDDRRRDGGANLRTPRASRLPRRDRWMRQRRRRGERPRRHDDDDDLDRRRQSFCGVSCVPRRGDGASDHGSVRVAPAGQARPDARRDLRTTSLSTGGASRSSGRRCSRWC